MTIVRLLLLFLLTSLTTLGGHRLNAHALEPGFLELVPLGDDWRVTWRIPQVGGSPMQIDAVLPENCSPRTSPALRFDGRAFVSGWVTNCKGGLSQTPLLIEGLDQTATDVLVRYVPEEGAGALNLRLTPDAPSVVLPAAVTTWQVFKTYIGLGVDHILGGIDHLLFVLALMLLIRDIRKLVGAITAFTVAHSITLALSALDLVSLPIPPVEAVIALSIMFLAAEILAPDTGTLRFSERFPWVVSFSFGLLHGLGFASALREIGLPQDDIPAALLAFNIGVEAGQLMFIAAVLAVLWLLRLGLPKLINAQLRRGAPAMQLPAYAIGGIAAYWTIDRILGFVA